MTEDEKVTFDNLTDALKFLDKHRDNAQKNIDDYKNKVKQLTGYFPADTIGPLDVAIIIKNVLKL